MKTDPVVAVQKPGGPKKVVLLCTAVRYHFNFTIKCHLSSSFFALCAPKLLCRHFNPVYTTVLVKTIFIGFFIFR